MTNKRIIGREPAVEALAGLCKDYRGTALRAIREGGENVYIPADPRDLNILSALENPIGLMRLVSQGNNGKEPCYATIDELRNGHNEDGTAHKGYLEVDVVAKLVTDLCDRNQKSVVPTGQVKPLSLNVLFRGLSGLPDSYCL
jgi:hypothetical protein